MAWANSWTSSQGSDLATLGWLILAFIIAIAIYLMCSTAKKSAEEGWRSRREERFIEDITDAIKDIKPKEESEHDQFIRIYLEVFCTDEKTAEHAYKNTDKAVREAIIKQYGDK